MTIHNSRVNILRLRNTSKILIFKNSNRIVTPKSTRQVADISFTSYGAHINNYPHTYLTVAAAIGGSKEEIDKFFVRFEKTFKDYQKEIDNRAKKLQDKVNNAEPIPTTDPK